MLRGDHRVNEIKLRNALRRGLPPRPRGGVRRRRSARPASSARSARRRPSCSTRASRAAGGYVTGANRPDEHLRGVEPGRDFAFERDRRAPRRAGRHRGRARDPRRARHRGRQHLQARHALLRAARRDLPRRGRARAQPIWMGSYGIGPARIAAAAVEQFADEHGIAWPRAIAPWDVELVGLGKPGTEERALADRLYDELRAAGLDALYDDRDAGPGREVRRRRAARRAAAPHGGPADGRRGRGRGAGAPRPRGARPSRSRAPPRRRRTCGAASRRARAGSPSAGSRGWTAPGPPPPETLAGQPLNPWTIPNAIGYVRLALLPVFLVLALSSDDRHGPAAGDPLRRHRLGGLPRRDRRARHRPVLAPRHAARPARRPPAGHLRRGRVLALRAAAALGARRCSPRASCSWSRSCGSGMRRGHRPEGQLARPRRACGR